MMCDPIVPHHKTPQNPDFIKRGYVIYISSLSNGIDGVIVLRRRAYHARSSNRLGCKCSWNVLGEVKTVCENRWGDCRVVRNEKVHLKME